MRLTIALLAAILAVPAASFAGDGHDQCHHIWLHGDDNPIHNGADLLAAVTHIHDASAEHPYVIDLEAGTYSLASPLTLLPYISLKGAGMTATTLQPVAGSTFITTLYFQDQLAPTYVQALSNESLSELTIIGNQPLSATVNGFLTIEHVQLISTNANLSALDLISVGSHFFVTNSLLGGVQIDSLWPISTPAGTPNPISSILSSEVDLDVAISPPFNLVCMADYSAAGAPIPQTCH